MQARPKCSAPLEARDLSLLYERKTAVEDLSLIANVGVLALIGPNGAGKSTALRAMSGLLKPSSGQIRFRGEDLW